MITTYKPGSASIVDPGKNYKVPNKIRIGVFGVMGSGKSACINSFLFAQSGKNHSVFIIHISTFTS